jgi:hypothetical protein
MTTPPRSPDGDPAVPLDRSTTAAAAGRGEARPSFPGTPDATVPRPAGTDDFAAGRAQGRAVEIVVDGKAVPAAPGMSVAAALLASGRKAWRTTASGAPRGLFCGIGVCFDCTATVDGRPHTRTCITPVGPGLTVDTSGGPR